MNTLPVRHVLEIHQTDDELRLFYIQIYRRRQIV